jgi:hypothetical protein
MRRSRRWGLGGGDASTATAKVSCGNISGWGERRPALLIENSNATVCGINERNDNREPVTFWARETAKMLWVYLGQMH